MAIKRKQDAAGNDLRFQTQRRKSRKAIRKAQRKSEKQKHHQNIIQYKERLKGKQKPNKLQEQQVEPEKPSKRRLSKTHDMPQSRILEEKTEEQREIEYLERQLLKNRKGAAKTADVFQTLRKEFVNDGFDDEFLDFLSNISHMAEKGKRISKKSGNSKTYPGNLMEQSDEDDDDDIDEEEIEGDDEDGEEEDEEEEVVEEEVEEEEDDDDEEEEEEEEDYDHDDDEEVDSEDAMPTVKRVRFNLDGEEKPKGTTRMKEKVKDAKPLKIDKNTIEAMKRRQMGLINRISEGNFTLVVKEVIDIYTKMHSSGSEQQSKTHVLAVEELIRDLSECTVKLIIQNENTVISLVAIHTALICALCNTVGMNLGYVYCHKLLKTIDKALPILFENRDGKELSEAKQMARNSIMSFAVISHLDMLDSDIVFHLFKIMSTQEITEHIAQILMVLLRYTGHKIKTENPTSFHNIIEHLNKMLDQYKESHGDITQSRLRFFQQEIESFKLSKEKKPLETFDFLKTIIKRDFRYRGGATNPQISHQTLLKFTKTYDAGKTNSHEILQKLDVATQIAIKSVKDDDPNSTDALLQKAAALRLYSNCQKSTFVAIMGAISPQHAVERIMDLGVKPTQQNEVLYTIVHSLMSEKFYNEYYTEVVKNLARLPSTTGKRFTRASVCTLIAIIEHLHEKKPRKCDHLGKFFGDFVTSKILELRLLRFIKKEQADNESVEAFIRSLFAYLVEKTPVENEEHVIEQLMQLTNEDIFEVLCEAWSEYLEQHCEKALPIKGRKVMMEACRRIFSLNTDE
ncbi:Suppressor of glycerol defect protein 1 [Babesia sp. Xinjiang]|uniref:Suppressor of glycerol defect protein 1 n=1 Tax=Babesia sp. Xinjiang TaxID=462227 RepID=UPI000A23AED4|nr:Suppressor of glycerol defect protein 1 [Babesia sp. Xinjiang]ORM39709.1 Suppressor of glycerol defect protein 1 [Babesia sp. Xinjiang]